MDSNEPRCLEGKLEYPVCPTSKAELEPRMAMLLLEYRREAVQSDPERLEVLSLLGAACKKAGEFDRAVRWPFLFSIPDRLSN